MTTPTPAELEILNVLWQLGEAKIQAVNDTLNKIRPIGYTTTLKSMQLMLDKGYLERRKVGKSHIYRPLIHENTTKTNLLNKFVNATFAGSKTNLMMQLLGNKEISKEELAQIKQFIHHIEEDNNG